MRLLPSLRHLVFFRKIASASRFPLYNGQILSGKRWQYEITQQLSAGWSSTIFYKTRILGKESGLRSGWAAIKSAPISNQTDLLTELNEYANGKVSSCRFIRRLLDIIPLDEGVSLDVRNKGVADSAPYLAFAWMDGDLYEFFQRGGKKDLALFELITTAIWHALVIFEENHHVHTDIKRGNTLINFLKPDMIDFLEPGWYEVSLADLGCATGDGVAKDLRGAPTSAAPEVLEGKGYSHPADI